MTQVAVLYVHGSALLYGSDRTLLHLVSHLDQERFAPIVVLPEAGPLIPALEAAGAEVHIQPLCVLHRTADPFYWMRFLLRIPQSARALRNLIRTRDVRLIHSNTSHVLDGSFAAYLTRAPHVWHIREIHTGLSRVGRWLSCWMRASSQAIFAVSRASQAAFFPGRVDDPKLHIIYDGIDVTRFHPERQGAAIRAEFGLAADTPLAGVVGRIAHWKGHRAFLDAAAWVYRRCPEARFLVVGDAVTEGDLALKQALQSQVHRLGLEEAVIFTGVREDVPEIMAALDVHVLPSEMPEPWGLVVLEAMASGLPVIATRQGGPLEMVVDGVTGHLVPPNDAEAMGQAMLALFENPEQARAMGQAGRARCESMFTLERAARDMMAVYDELL